MIYKGTYMIKNISDYIEVLSKIKKIEGKKELWYRGQRDSDFRLRASIHRCGREISDYYGREVKPRSISGDSRGQEVIFPNIRTMLEEFKEKVRNEVKFEINNDFEWMFLGQHYGLLTPLLDWSEDPFVALFFAIDKIENNSNYYIHKDIEKDIEEFKEYNSITNSAAIYILDPGEFNKNSAFYIKDNNGENIPLDYPVEITDENIEVFRGYIDGGQYFPLCIKAPKREYRICRQSGNFVCMGGNVQPIDYYQICNTFLYKIYIPYSVVEEIKKELEILNITSDAIYGDDSILDDYAKDIREKEEGRFKKIIEDLNEKYSSKNL